jgi:hypothetical protein
LNYETTKLNQVWGLEAWPIKTLFTDSVWTSSDTYEEQTLQFQNLFEEARPVLGTTKTF